MSKVFTEAHELTREMVEEYGMDYRTQFAITLSYLLNKEDEEMTIEKWYEGLTEKEKSKMKDGAEARTGFMRNGETAKEWMARGEENLKKIVEEKYNLFLQEEEIKAEKQKQNEEIEKEEEKQYQKDLARGVATIELYESNRYRCWVAEINGLDEHYGLDRNFIDPVEIKGNYKIYELKEGRYYNYLNDKKQHFVKVVNSKLIEMTQQEMADEVR